LTKREKRKTINCLNYTSKDLHREGQTIIMVTHEEQYAAEAERTLILDDGRIVSVKDNRRN